MKLGTAKTINSASIAKSERNLKVNKWREWARYTTNFKNWERSLVLMASPAQA